MDDIKTFKESAINEYIASSLVEGWIDVSKVKSDLKNILGEEPAVELKYIKETKIDEGSDKESVIEKLESVIVYYTYEGGTKPDETPDYRYSKLEYII